MTEQRMIVVEDLVKRYGSGDDAIEAVRGVSFEVEPGEIYGLLGANGAGKSTTVLVLATLLAPTSGRAIVAGQDVVTDATAVRRAVGVALQETGIDELQTARELLVLHGRLVGADRRSARERAGEVLELVGLQDAADRRVRGFSGGMRRRLDLGLALVHRPRVLFLDEPTTGLDPASRRAVWEEVETLRAGGVTILLTTQYLEEADRLADRVAIMDHGQIVADGPPAELKRRVGDDVLELTFATTEQARAAAAALGDGATLSEETVRLSAPDGAARVPAVVHELQQAGAQPSAVTLTRPTLDDVFLELTGRAPEGGR